MSLVIVFGTFTLAMLCSTALSTESEDTRCGSTIKKNPTNQGIARCTSTEDDVHYDRWPDTNGHIIDVPLLAHIGSDLVIEHSDTVATAFFGSLETLGGSIVLQRNYALKRISFLALRSIQDDFFLYEDVVLTSLHLPALQSIGGRIYIYCLYELQTISMPMLTSTALVNGNEAIWIRANPELVLVDMPQIEKSNGDITICNNGKGLKLSSTIAGSGFGYKCLLAYGEHADDACASPVSCPITVGRNNKDI